MEYRTLGDGALQVSAICMGTMTFGEQNDEAQAHALLDRAWEAGVNFYDTAEMYPVPARAGQGGILVPVCSGADLGRTVTIPLRPVLPPDQGGKGCCAKGCHAGSSRKRGTCHN